MTPDGASESGSAVPASFEGDPAFVPYLVAGDPSFDDSLAYVEALVDGGADVVELGLPFSEPIAEGPTIQRAVARSLDAGMTPDRYFEFVEALDVAVPLVCMTYYNLVYRYGAGRGPRSFVERATAAGIDGFVVPDLPAEEAGPMRSACDEFGRDLVFVVAPTTGEDRLERLLELTSGYVYVQARLGVTGAREDVSGRTREFLDRLSGYDVPRAVGFGISTGDQAAEVVAAGADGVIVGSALVDIVAETTEDGAPGRPTSEASGRGSGEVSSNASGEASGEASGSPTVEKTATRLAEKARELKSGAIEGVQRRPEPEYK